MQSIRTMIAGRRGHSVAGFVVRATAAAACALFICGCTTDQQQVASAPEAPTDYRLRHPITLQEADHTLELFIGANRGELNPTQRAQVMAFGVGWKREATGGIIVSRPVGSSNELASLDAMHEIVSILTASGLPPQSVVVQTHPATAANLATVRISYPRIRAQAGPCGIWPKDIGPSMNRDYFENQPSWNFGCATQRNLAAMVADPSDLVQPHGEDAAYTMRRTTVVEKYRAGQSTATTDSGASASAKITEVGK
ncbi:MAG TPA: CpaD family pilus assembly protein [Xanthobacteraceae bacterium]|nr:CpaD family pilus assembly protein [Xanthobacteraceae bacterium]